MPYFSFSIKSNIDKILHFLGDNNINLEINTKYYSKNSKIYKLFNNRKYYNLIENIQYEKREKIENIGKKILICLPPGIGLGDSVEYALFSKALIKSNLFERVGIAYVDRFDIIFKRFSCCFFKFFNRGIFLRCNYQGKWFYSNYVVWGCGSFG